MFMDTSTTLMAQFQKSTSRPIAGTCVATAFTNPLQQAKMSDVCTLQGSAVELKNDTLSPSGNNGMGLAGNVLTATKATTKINGFVVDCASTMSCDTNDFPRLCKNQVGYVALIGSGAKVYLPADASLQGVGVDTELKWDATNNCLSTTTGVALTGVKIVSQVVNGVAGRMKTVSVTPPAGGGTGTGTGTATTMELNVSESYETLVVKVRL